MLIFGICISLIVVGFIFYIYDEFGTAGAFGTILFFIGVFGLIGASIALPIKYYTVKAQIKQFEAVRLTVEAARQKGVDIEDAALKLAIIDSNTWLAETQYWNSTIFDIFIPDKVEELKPLQ